MHALCIDLRVVNVAYKNNLLWVKLFLGIASSEMGSLPIKESCETGSVLHGTALFLLKSVAEFRSELLNSCSLIPTVATLLQQP